MDGLFTGEILMISFLFPAHLGVSLTQGIIFLPIGWRPRRSIVLCSWGGEEYGLLGSTEWVEVCSYPTHSFFFVVGCLWYP